MRDSGCASSNAAIPRRRRVWGTRDTRPCPSSASGRIERADRADRPLRHIGEETVAGVESQAARRVGGAQMHGAASASPARGGGRARTRWTDRARRLKQKWAKPPARAVCSTVHGEIEAARRIVGDETFDVPHELAARTRIERRRRRRAQAPAAPPSARSRGTFAAARAAESIAQIAPPAMRLPCQPRAERHGETDRVAFMADANRRGRDLVDLQGPRHLAPADREVGSWLGPGGGSG